MGVIKETRDMLHIVYHMKELQKKGTMKVSAQSKAPCGCQCGAPTTVLVKVGGRAHKFHQDTTQLDVFDGGIKNEP